MGGKPRPEAELEIPDRKLRLALLDEVMRKRSGYDWVPSMKSEYEMERSAHPTWKPWDAYPEHDVGVKKSIEEFLVNVPISKQELRTETSLVLDGDRGLYAFVSPRWWDHGDGHFAIRNLAGIENCASLTCLNLVLVEGASLRPLTGLPRLRELSLCALSQFRDINYLLAIPSLRKLVVYNISSSANATEWRSVLANHPGLGS